jgi:hypothetical protein
MVAQGEGLHALPAQGRFDADVAALAEGRRRRVPGDERALRLARELREHDLGSALEDLQRNAARREVDAQARQTIEQEAGARPIEGAAR